MNKPSSRLTSRNFPKLKRMTSSGTGFTLAKALTADLRQTTADHIFVREIEKKIEEQRKDLEERNVAITSLLGHFEQIASMCRDEKNKNIEFRTQNMDLVKEVKKLKKTIETNAEKASKSSFVKIESAVNNEEYQNIWRENNRLKEAIRVSENDVEEKINEINALKHAISCGKSIQNGLEKTNNDLNIEVNIAKGVKRKLEEEMANLRMQAKQDKQIISEYVGQAQIMNDELEKIKEENQNLISILDAKEKEIAKIKSINSKLTANYQEILENTNKTNVISYVSIDENDNMMSIVEKFTAALSKSAEKIEALEREKLQLKDKINKGSTARKELLISIEGFRRANQNDLLKYEKLLQQHESTKKIKDAEFKDVSEALLRVEAQKKAYMADLQSTEVELYSERQTSSQIKQRLDEAMQETEKLEAKILFKDEKIDKLLKTIEVLNEIKLQHSISQKELKCSREELSGLGKINESLLNKHAKEKSLWQSQENSFILKIQGLQEELNNEKTFNSIHLQEVIKLKRALAVNDNKQLKESMKEDDKRLRARIAMLEMDTAEDKENIEKLKMNITYSTSQLIEKSEIIAELERANEGLMKKVNNPNFLQVEEKAQLLKEREDALSRELSKINYAVEAFENGMTCIVCLDCLDHPILLVPCGHAICNKCKPTFGNPCPSCPQKSTGQFRIDWLDQLVDKIIFQRQILESMKQLLSKAIFA